MRILKLLLFFCLLGYQLHAQRVIIKNKTGTETSKKPSPEYDSRIAIKYNIGNAAIGEFPISIEYAIADRYTVEAGIGLLHGNYLINLIFNPFTLINDRWDTPKFNCEDCDLSYKLNSSFFIKAKYFYDDSYFKGSYYSLGISYRPYLGVASLQNSTGLNQVDWYTKVWELNFTKGSHLFDDEHFLLDIYYGGGILYKNMQVPRLTNTNQEEVLITEEATGFNLAFRMGIVIGYVL